MKSKIPALKYCESIFDGTHETPKPSKSGHPLVTSKNILRGDLELESTHLISDEDYSLVQKRSAVSKWDILFSMIGSVGEIYLETNNDIRYAIKNLGVFSCKDEYKAKWLYYYLKSPYARKVIANYLNGAVQKFLPLDFLRQFPVENYQTNKKTLIDFLYNLDSKIAINKKIKVELEQLAKAIFDYWFVQFEFPNDKSKPFKSAGGRMEYKDDLKREIPIGWHVHKIGDVLDTSLGGTPSTSNKSFWTNGTINWLNSAEMNTFPIIKSENKITEEAVKNSATKLMCKGTVALSITRYIRPTILAIDSCANQSVVGIHESEKFKSSYIYPNLINEITRYMIIRTGAMQPHINLDTIKTSLIVEPENNVLKKYYEIVDPIYQQIIKNALETEELIDFRDFLFPMLMNGQIEVN